ncbi:MAG: MarR family transcriptional regulator [Euryarchaeota archaeon]|nr:MarR family transcriptional regulator [Euryarchaeota archaeon]
MRPLATSFLVLAEIATRQPAVKQADIARELGISAQAVSECIKALIKAKLVERRGKGSYLLTREGYEHLLSGARELRELSGFILSEVVAGLRVYTAVAAENLDAGEEVSLWMERGLLYAARSGGRARGRVLNRARRGEDVGVVEVQELIAPAPGEVNVVKIPKVEKGGSRAVELARIRRLAESAGFVAALGVEARVALEKAGIACDAFFGSAQACVEAALHGVNVLALAVEDELHLLLRRLERARLEYRVIDGRKENEGRA